MVKIADDLTHATELVRTFAGRDWDQAIDSTDRDALVWLLEVAGGQHAYIRSRAFRDVVTAAYQMGRQAGLAECTVAVNGTELTLCKSRVVESENDKVAHRQKTY
ncbi:MAG: hypothetical protein GY832_41320 [Chloroflexi bacterium]|nr:hypothetical protein [Chloroflexota bacterium]